MIKFCLVVLSTSSPILCTIRKNNFIWSKKHTLCRTNRTFFCQFLKVADPLYLTHTLSSCLIDHISYSCFRLDWVPQKTTFAVIEAGFCGQMTYLTHVYYYWAELWACTDTNKGKSPTNLMLLWSTDMTSDGPDATSFMLAVWRSQLILPVNANLLCTQATRSASYTWWYISTKV